MEPINYHKARRGRGLIWSYKFLVNAINIDIGK